MLDARNLCAAENGRDVLCGAGLHVAVGEAVAVLGPGGSGRTALARALSGLLPLQEGRVVLDGRDVTGETPRGLLDAGLAHVPRGGQVFPTLSVRDNLLLGATHRARLRRTRTLAAVLEVFPRLVRHMERAAGTLPVAEQRMLAIGRALMALPRLLLLDDPALGVPADTQVELFGALLGLGGRGLSILLAAPLSLPPLAVANRAYLLDQGRVVREAPAVAARDWCLATLEG